MSKRVSIAVTACAVLVCATWLTLRATGQDQAGGPAQPTPEQMKEMMDKWMKSMTPGPHHEKLQVFVGEWDVVSKMWWGGPDGPPPTVSKGSDTVKWILGKRYIETHHKGTMTIPDPQTGEPKNVPYEGQGVIGYDNVRNLYVGNWMDNMSTAIINYKGTATPDGKTFRMYGEMDEPMLTMYGRHVKYVWTVQSKDEHTFAIYDLAAGEDYKVIEMVYTRKK